VSRVRLLFSEAWASIRMNLSTTVAATMTVLTILAFGVYVASQWLERKALKHYNLTPPGE